MCQTPRWAGHAVFTTRESTVFLSSLLKRSQRERYHREHGALHTLANFGRRSDIHVDIFKDISDDSDSGEDDAEA